MSDAARFLDCIASRQTHAFFRAEQNARINVALQRHACANLLAHGCQVHAPIDAQYIRARFCGCSQQMARSFGVENDGGIAGANFFNQKLRGRQREFAILLER